MIREYIERRIGKDRYAKIRTDIYRESVDCTTSILFYTVVNGANEKYWAGMNWDEVGQARVIGGLVNLSTFWIYTRYRDVIRRKFGIDENNGFLKKLIPDSITGITFGWPAYTGIVAFSSDSFEKTVRASFGFLAYCSFVSYPYSLFLDLCRKLCGTRSRQTQAELYDGDV